MHLKSGEKPELLQGWSKRCSKAVGKGDLGIGTGTDGEDSDRQIEFYRRTGCSGFFFLALSTASL